MQERAGPERRLHLPLLRRGHHGAASASTRVRPVPLGLPQRLDPSDLRQHRPGGHGRASTRTAACRTATTTPGSATPRRTSWSWARRHASSTRMPRAGCASPSRSTTWCGDGEIGPVMLGRDHHDVGGTDSPFRETATSRTASNIMADMAVQCFAGNVARGMSLVVLSNGGGCRHRQGHQRRLRPGPGRQRRGSTRSSGGRALGRHGRRGTAGVGA